MSRNNSLSKKSTIFTQSLWNFCENGQLMSRASILYITQTYKTIFQQNWEDRELLTFCNLLGSSTPFLCASILSMSLVFFQWTQFWLRPDRQSILLKSIAIVFAILGRKRIAILQYFLWLHTNKVYSKNPMYMPSYHCHFICAQSVHPYIDNCPMHLSEILVLKAFFAQF